MDDLLEDVLEEFVSRAACTPDRDLYDAESFRFFSPTDDAARVRQWKLDNPRRHHDYIHEWRARRSGRHIAAPRTCPHCGSSFTVTPDSKGRFTPGAGKQTFCTRACGERWYYVNVEKPRRAARKANTHPNN